MVARREQERGGPRPAEEPLGGIAGRLPNGLPGGGSDNPRSRRRIAVTTGVLLLLATATVLVADAVEPAFEEMARASEPLAIANLLRILAACASVGVAISLYPILRSVDHTLAIGSVVFRTIEAVMYLAGVVAMLSVLPLSRQLASAAATSRETIETIADSTIATRHGAGLVAVIAFTIGGAMYYAVLYRARLVPRWLSGWGLVAAMLLFSACMLALFRDTPISDYTLLAAPIFLQEIVLAVWLLTKGFAPDTQPVRSPG